MNANTRWLVISVFLAVTAACSGATAERPSTAPEPSPDPAIRVIEGHVNGDGEYPGYTVEAPTGWSSSDGGFVVKAVPGVLGVSVWDVGRVPRDPCHWRGTFDDPGPTVEDLVELLSSQRMRDATTPTDVTLGGCDGLYLEWSVPDDMVVTGDADFAGCDVVRSNGHRDFISWLGGGGGSGGGTGGSSRYQQVAGQVDRLWILDVNGQPLVVDATFSPDVTATDRHELDQIVESIQFVVQAA